MHYADNGVSYAQLNCETGGIGDRFSDYGDSIKGETVRVYTLQGVEVYSTSRYDGAPLPLSPGIYIIATPVGSRKIMIQSLAP